MIQFKQDLKRFPRLIIGLIVLALGIHLTRASMFGLAPWAVLHDGLEETTGIPFGYITQLVGLVVLAISIVLFHTKIGVGTIFNVLLVGPVIEMVEWLFPFVSTSMVRQVFVFLSGLLIMTFGRSLYISSCLGQGPRDGLFVGLARTTGLPVKYVKFAIEFSVFAIGYALGGTVGIGTVLVVVLSGYLVQFYFWILGFNPHEKQKHSVSDYFIKKESS